jgi:lipopolysaccharide export system permease protein
MNSMFYLSDLVIKYGISLFKVMQFLLYLLPSTVAVTVPMAFLVGILLTYSRLVQDNEYYGMQASGISVKDITMPSIYLALGVTVVMIFFNNYILPAANIEYKKLYFDMAKKRSSIMLQEHTFINDFDNYVFYIGDKDNKNDTLKNVIVFVKDRNDPDQPAKVILSHKGELMNDEQSMRLALELEDGIIQLASYKQPEKMDQINFQKNFVDLDIQGVLRARANPDNIKGAREMTSEELYSEIQKGSKSSQDRNWLYIEFYKKFSIPFAVIAFTIVGIPLGLMTKKGGRVMGISFSIVLIFIYYILLSIGQNYGYIGKMNYFLAAWGSNIFLIGIGLILFIYMALRSSFKTKAAVK